MRHPVIVVGGGPVGLTCAALLSRAGVAVRVLEAAPTRVSELRASTWHPPTLDLLDGLELAAPLIDRGLVAPTWQIRMHPSGERAVFNLALLEGETRHPYRLQCEQQAYCELLEARLGSSASGCIIERSVEVLDVCSKEDLVSVEIQDLNGGRTRLECDWLIGADGARSAVRRAVGIAFEGSTYPETTILATTHFPFERHLEGLTHVNYCWAPEGTFSLLRLPQLWRVSLYADAGESVDEALRPEAVRAKLERIADFPKSEEILEIRAYRTHQRLASTYRSRRVLLAGDAAHLNSPSGGMGMNGGLHDAFSLCEKLLRVLMGEPETLLDLYVRQRRKVAAEQILGQAHENRTRMQERNPAERRAALEALQAIAASPTRAREHLMKTSMITGLRIAAMQT